MSGHLPNGDKYHKHIDFPEGVKQDAGVAWNQAGADRWQAWVDLNSTQADYDAAQTALNDLLTIRDNPQEAQLQAAQAPISKPRPAWRPPRPTWPWSAPARPPRM